jgi:hypothetical protein
MGEGGRMNDRPLGGFDETMHGTSTVDMSWQALGNALAGVLFLIVAIYDFTQDDSGIGVVFVVFAAVFLGLGLSGMKQQRQR